MWELKKVRALVSGIVAQRRSGRRASAGRAIDELPPVLGPGDWSIGMMADRSSAWYFDRR